MKANLRTTFSVLIVVLINLAIILPAIFIYRKPFPEIIFLPSSKVVFDKSFAESVYRAGNKFQDDYGNEFGYVMPNSFDENGYVELLTTAFNNGADYTVGVGSYSLEQAYIQIYGDEQNPKSKYYEKISIYIDDTSQRFVSDYYSNIISIRFLANEAAFVEGIIASIYVVGSYNDPNEWKLGTWGGIQIPGVIQWLSGFEQGVNWFNYYILGTDIYGNDISVSNSEAAKSSFKLSPGNSVEIINYTGTQIDYSGEALPSTSTYYSNSFNIGEGKAIATGLENKGAKVLFPIAGGQTSDAFEVASKSKNNVKVIGVDTDARLTYPNYDKYILSSGIKNISGATYFAIWYATRKFMNYEKPIGEIPETSPWNFLEPIDNGGWNVNEDVSNVDLNKVNPYGHEFIGNFDNGGVGVTHIDDTKSTISQSWISLIQKYSPTNEIIINDNGIKYDSSIESLNLMIDNSVEAQEEYANGVENFSYTFTIGMDGHLVENLQKPSTGSFGTNIWIPNWETYHGK